jgi:hypothetical protein
MIEVKRFSGTMNSDDLPENILAPQHTYAKNLRFYGGQNGLTAENVRGNYIINNNGLPVGDNICLGSFFDSLNSKIYWFNWNSNGDNGIYVLDTETETVSSVFICGTDSATDILNFDPNYPVHSVVMVYREAGQGNLLYWTDGLNRPRYLNVDTVATLAPFTESMLNAAKIPPLAPPGAGYGTDLAITYNNVINRYFRFAYRWVYENGEKSTFSPSSICPVVSTIQPENPQLAVNGNYISIFNIDTPSTNDFKSIEVYGQEYNGTTWGDFFLITDINRVSGSLPYTESFSFYNDAIYTPISIAESGLRFDYLPDVANTMELLNGNVIIYGGVTEGYDNIAREDIDVQITSSLQVGASSYPLVSRVWKWNQIERFGLIYFDEYGKTNGVISYLNNATDNTNFDVFSPQYPGESLGSLPFPRIAASINHIPPDWAVTYQWVRQDTAPLFFLQYVTNDYQSDSDYLYFCIEGLVYNNTSNNFIPSYDFAPGDRVRVLGEFVSTGMSTSGNVSAYINQYDFQVLGIVKRQMTSNPSVTNQPVQGSFIKIRKPTFVFPAYSKTTLIELYTPAPVVKDEEVIFYEWGKKYDIYEISGIKYHVGQTQNQTASQPALFSFDEGYVYCKLRNYPLYLNYGIGLCGVVDRNYNDFQPSQANSNSKGWPINVNAKRKYLPVTVRWGGGYYQNDNVNELNRFFPQDIDTIDLAKGDIRRFKARDRILRVFQDRGCGQYGVYARFIQNNQGQPELVTTNTIITTNNIQYYAGVFGLSGYPTNLASAPNADYFADVVTGRAIRLGRDGLTDLGMLYKGQYYLSGLVTPYNKTITGPGGYNSKVMGFFDFFENQYHTILQGTESSLNIEDQILSPNQKEYSIYLSGTAAEGDQVTITVTDNVLNTETYTYTCTAGESALDILNGISNQFLTSQYFAANVFASSPYPYILITSLFNATFTVYTASITHAPDGAYNFSFNESRNGFCSFYDYHPEWATGANDIIYTWLNGGLYKHDNTTNYCQFYGDNKNAEITIVFNSAIHAKKSWNSLMEIASAIWAVPTMQTNTYSYGTTKQVSSLVPSEFTLLEGNPSSAIKRDANSSGGKINGNFMKGNYLVVKFQRQNAQNLITLSEVSARFTDSPLTVK